MVLGFWFSLMKEPTSEPTIQTYSGTQIIVPTASISHRVNTDIENIIIPPIDSGWTTARVHAAFGWSRFCCFCHKGQWRQEQGSPGSLCAPDGDSEEQRHRPLPCVGVCGGRVTLRCRSQRGTLGCCGLSPLRPQLAAELSRPPSLCAGGGAVWRQRQETRGAPGAGNLIKSGESLWAGMPEGDGSVQPWEKVAERGPHQCD